MAFAGRAILALLYLKIKSTLSLNDIKNNYTGEEFGKSASCFAYQWGILCTFINRWKHDMKMELFLYFSNLPTNFGKNGKVSEQLGLNLQGKFSKQIL